MHHLKDDNGTLITDRVEIANPLGAAIEKVLPPTITLKSSNLSRHNRTSNINFKTNKIFRYNKKFTIRDLKRSSKKVQ